MDRQDRGTGGPAMTGRRNPDGLMAAGGFADSVVREVTSWEGVTTRHGTSVSGGEASGRDSGTVEFRLGRHVLGSLPLGGLVDERTVVARLRDAYERARVALDRRAGVPA